MKEIKSSTHGMFLTFLKTVNQKKTYSFLNNGFCTDVFVKVDVISNVWLDLIFNI